MKKKTLKQIEALTRSLSFNLENVDKESRTVTLPVSSELPVKRWFGNEILDHSKAESIDLSRLNNAAAVLEDHEGRQIGVIENAYLNTTEKRLWATLRFSRNQYADEVYQDIIDGIRRNVSIGYRVNEMVLEKSDDKEETYRVSRWMPYEISIVSVPADPGVGVGRSGRNPDMNDCEVISEEPEKDVNENTRNTKMNPEEIRKMMEEVLAAQRKADAPKTPEVTAVKAEDVLKGERGRITEIQAMGSVFQMSEEANRAIAEGIAIEAFRKMVTDKLAERNKELSQARDHQKLGLSAGEIRQFSFLRALNALASNDHEAQKAAAFEFEVSRAYAEKIKSEPRGIFVPPEILRAEMEHVREFNQTTGGGSNLKATNLLAGSFIDKLDNAMVVMSLGATILRDLVGNIAIPRQSGRSTAYWIDPESAGITAASNPTIDQVTLSPKTVGGYTEISRRTLKQSSIDVENLVRNDLAITLALAIDYAALLGTGLSNTPTGVINTSGIGSVTWTTANTPTWAKVVQLETEVNTDNALTGALNYATGAAMRGTCKTTPKETGYPVYIMGDDGRLNGYNCAITNQLTAGYMLFGNFADILLGMWGGLDLQVNPYIDDLEKKGAVRVTALQDVDVAVRRAVSFAVASNPSGS